MTSKAKQQSLQKIWFKWSRIPRNNKALLICILGVVSFGLSSGIYNELPESEPIQLSSTQELLANIGLVLFLVSIALVILGSLFYSLRTRCPHCQKNIFEE